MYREEMNFDNMKQLIAMGAFSVMMCIVAMFTMNGCTKANNRYVDTDSIMVDSLVDSLQVDTLDLQDYTMGAHMDSVVYGEK